MALRVALGVLLFDGVYSYQTLKNLGHVSRMVLPEVRSESLTWTHHKEVAALPPADQDKAVRPLRIALTEL